MRWAVAATLVTAALAAAAASPAHASQRLDVNATGVELTVGTDGRALVSYRARGRAKRVVVWGAVNARAPHATVPQVNFRLRYSASVSVKNACAAYDGPALRWFVAGCRAPDGSYWALQRWQRMLPGRGAIPTAGQAAWELRISHWSGPLPEFVIKLDWAYRRYDHLYGWYSYLGHPIFGFRSSATGIPYDAYGRNVYLDTYDSAYGPGWRREGGFLTQSPRGNFCWGFYPREGRPTGNGRRYRATIIGPGVMPDMYWESTAPGPYNPQLDATANAEQRELAAGSRYCKPN